MPEAAPLVSRPWAVLLGLTLGVAITNGFARFAYGLILPAMRADLGWSYAEAGWINTANALGYVAGAAATLILVNRLSAARLFAWGVAGTALCLTATGLSADFLVLTIWRVLTGVFGAAAFIAGGALSALLWRDDPRRNALAIAVYFGVGGGLGMLPPAALPWLFASEGAGAWPLAWLGLGGLSLAASPLCLAAAARLRPPPGRQAAGTAPPLRAMRWEIAAYACFGLGYIVYITFLVAWMQERGAGPGIVSGLWAMIGFGIAASPWLWRPVFAASASGGPLALVMTVLAAGALLPAFGPDSPATLLISGALFGLSVFMAPGAVTSFARRNLPQTSWGAAVSLFTLVFALGQTLGPLAAGWLGDLTGDVGDGVLAGGLVLGLGAAAAAMQRRIAPA